MRTTRAVAACSSRGTGNGFTLLELIVSTAIIAALAGLLIPGLAQAKKEALRSACFSQLRQQGIAWQIYLGDHGDRFPDRRDLKVALPGGYKPWESWPKSDPRSGWAVAMLMEEGGAWANIWRCPATDRSVLGKAAQVIQTMDARSNAPAANYWMWRFDRPDDPVPGDNFWGRTPEEAVSCLRDSGNATIGTVDSASDVELSVDVYFPRAVTGLTEDLRGRSAHRRGRNRLFLDGHAAFLKDVRTPGD